MTASQRPARYMGRAWRAAYGVTLTRDEIRLVQAHRGLPAGQQQEHLRRYASGLVVEQASDGRVPVELAVELAAARRWARDMGRVARKGA